MGRRRLVCDRISKTITRVTRDHAGCHCRIPQNRRCQLTACRIDLRDSLGPIRDHADCRFRGPTARSTRSTCSQGDPRSRELPLPCSVQRSRGRVIAVCAEYEVLWKTGDHAGRCAVGRVNDGHWPIRDRTDCRWVREPQSFAAEWPTRAVSRAAATNCESRASKLSLYRGRPAIARTERRRIDRLAIGWQIRDHAASVVPRGTSRP